MKPTLALLFSFISATALAQPRAPESGLAFAQQLGDAFATVAERTSPSVVSIRVEVHQARPAAFGLGDQVVRGGGSGVVLRSDGHILTNNHVVGQAARIEVRLHDGRTFPARIVGTDPATDLAVIKIDATDLPAATFASRERIRVGEWAVAVGSPFGLDYTVTAGIVSALGRGGVGMNEIEDYVQTDASINPGNSGGPLVNLRGEVIGINTMIVGRNSGIGFAVVSELAEQVGTQIIDGGEVRRAYIGVSFQDLTPALAAQVGVPDGTRGALVAGIEPGGPAASAGLRAGDVIVAVGGQPLPQTGDLIRRVLAARVGSEMQFTVLRRGRRQEVTVRTAERPSRQARATPEVPEAGPYGLSLDGLSRSEARRARLRSGVIVRGVEAGSIAARAGLLAGDIIVEADRRPVGQPAQVRAALEDGEVLLRLRRGRGALFVAFRTR